MKPPKVYPQEKYPKDVRYVEDTLINRMILREGVGEPMFALDDFAYIVVDVRNRTWHTSLSAHWLYRDQPPLMEIEDLLKEMKK